ncbi:MAG: TolC family protein [Candidatus Magnetoovum sp. WYHC-5]|nr:TolC family protein [Candidatus Magnetoovum sp. WYHC-5]
MRLFVFLIIIVLAELCTTPYLKPVWAYEEDAANNNTMPLTIEEAVNMAIENNFSIKVNKYKSESANAQIIVEESEFDPSLNIDLKQSVDKLQYISSDGGQDERLTELDTAIGGKFFTGTEYELSFNNKRYESSSYSLLINPYYSTNFALTLTQPLIKNFGIDVQTTQINVAKNKYQISNLDFDTKVIEIAAKTAKAYWNLKIAQYRLNSENVALELALHSQKQVSAKIEAGLLPAVDIYAADSEVASRQETLIDAKKDVLNAEDEVKQLLGINTWHYKINTVSEPTLTVETKDEATLIKKALKIRQDYRKTEIEKKNKELLLNYYKNQKLLDVDAFASFEVNGMGDDYPAAFEKISPDDKHYWLLGLSMNVPIGNRKNKGNYLAAKYNLNETVASLKELERNITQEVRAALREVEYANKRVSAAQKTLIAAKQNLDAKEGKLNEGLSTLNEVLQSQKEYATALYEEKKAVADLSISAIELKKTQGLLPY